VNFITIFKGHIKHPLDLTLRNITSLSEWREEKLIEGSPTPRMGLLTLVCGFRAEIQRRKNHGT
jgi:hypothetical protein